jgi:hypothetical protein
VPQDLIDAGSLAYQDGSNRVLEGGFAHGSLEIKGLQPGQPPSETIPENRARCARLTVLHAWFVPGDVQWLHEVASPHRIWSVDHAFFLPGQNQWTADLLRQHPDPGFGAVFPGAGLAKADLQAAFAPLSTAVERDIAEAVGSVPVSWGVAVSDLVELGRWLWTRLQRLNEEWR